MHVTVTPQTSGVVFSLEQAIRAIRKEIKADPPFSKANQVRRGELDQLADMLDRRR